MFQDSLLIDNDDCSTPRESSEFLRILDLEIGDSKSSLLYSKVGAHSFPAPQTRHRFGIWDLGWR